MANNASNFKKGLKCSSLGFTEEEYFKKKEELTKKSGSNPSEGDILWSISNQLLNEAMKKGDWHKMKILYSEMALFLHKEGKDCFKLLQERQRCELRQHQQNNAIKKVEIVSALDDKICNNCLMLDGKTFTIEEALKDMPIPVKDCSLKFNKEAPTGWCRCCYTPATN